MRRVLLKNAALSCAVTIVLALILALALGSPTDVVATAIGGVLAAADFMAIVWIVTGMLAPEASTPSKVGLGLLMVGKLGFVGALLWSAIVRHGLESFGIPLGIGAGLAGFAARAWAVCLRPGRIASVCRPARSRHRSSGARFH